MFSKIFYINLDRRQDRDENMKNIINKLNLQNKTVRIPAVDGKKLDLDNIPTNIITKEGINDAKNKNLRVGVPLTSGAIGCALSHRNVWKKIVDENIDSALILEDDVRIDPDFHKKMDYYKKYCPNSYDVIFLGYSPATIKYITASINDIFVRSNKVYGLFGYIVSRKGAEKLLKIFPIRYQIDTEMHRNFSSIDAYLVKPDYRIITSDISEDSKQFGTDIQVRENFEDLEHDNFIHIYIFMFIVLVVFLFVKSKK